MHLKRWNSFILVFKCILNRNSWHFNNVKWSHKKWVIISLTVASVIECMCGNVFYSFLLANNRNSEVVRWKWQSGIGQMFDVYEKDVKYSFVLFRPHKNKFIYCKWRNGRNGIIQQLILFAWFAYSRENFSKYCIFSSNSWISIFY